MGKRGFEVISSAVLFAFAVGVRALPFPDLLRSGRLEFFGNDAYYHARRILFGARNFPGVLDFDPYLNPPQGGEPIWSPLFDFVLAGLVRATGLGGYCCRECSSRRWPITVGRDSSVGTGLTG